MFDFAKVSIVADHLALMDGEEFNRSAISRYYYSLFGSLRLYLILVLGETSFAWGSDVHRRICDRLKYSDDPTEHSLGKTLDKLRQLRNLSDYDWENTDSEFFQNRLTFVQKESQIGLQQVDALKKSPPFNL